MLEDDCMKDIIIESMRFLVKDGRVIIYGFVIMPNHIHLIWQIQDKHVKHKVQQSFLKYTAQQMKFRMIDTGDKRLEDYKEKQIGVPFNMSLGGGSQGLLESMTFDGQDASDLGLAIEQNFAGSFIGSISQFKIYDSNISWCALNTLCRTERYEN